VNVAGYQLEYENFENFHENSKMSLRGLKMPQRFCWKQEFKGTWDCLLIKKKVLETAYFEDKDTWD
jgi:hypothetical protein